MAIACGSVSLAPRSRWIGVIVALSCSVLPFRSVEERMRKARRPSCSRARSSAWTVWPTSWLTTRQGPRDLFGYVRLLEQRVAVGDRLIGEAVAGKVEGDAAEIA